MLPAPKPVWRWPPAMFSRKDLCDAVREGFELHVSYTDKGNAMYRLSRDGIASPIGILNQSVAHRAYLIGTFERGEKQPDTWHRLTLKPKGRRP